MNIAAALLKLERLVSSVKTLEAKIKDHEDKEVIQCTIDSHRSSINNIKAGIDFDNRFEVITEAGTTCEDCTCGEVAKYPTVGEKLGKDIVEGIYAKVKVVKADGEVGKQVKYVKLED